MVNQRRYQPVQRKSRASLIILIVLAFLLMAAAIVLALSMPQEEQWPQETEPLVVQPALNTGFDQNEIQSVNTYPFAAGVVRVSGNQLSYLNIQGIEIFSHEIEMTTPFCVSAGSYLLAADRDGHAYAMINEQGVLYHGSTAGRITGAAVRADGYAALIEDQSSGNGLVGIYQPLSGFKLYDCYFPESGFVLSVGFSPYDDIFDVALLNTDGSALQPIFKRYSINGQEQGQLIPESQTVLPYIGYTSDGRLLTAGSTEVIALAYDQDLPLYRSEFYKVKSITPFDDKTAIIAAKAYGEKWQLFIMDNAGRLGSGYVIGEDVTELSVKNGKIVMGSGTELKVLDTNKGEWIMDQNMAVEIIRADFTDTDTITLVTKNGVRRLSLTS